MIQLTVLADEMIASLHEGKFEDRSAYLAAIEIVGELLENNDQHENESRIVTLCAAIDVWEGDDPELADWNRKCADG